MTKLCATAGVCGFIADIEASSEDGQMVTVKIITDCPSIAAMAKALPEELDAYSVCLTRYGTGVVFQAAASHCRHAACIVPQAIIKTIEVECGLALPKDASIAF